MRPALLLAWLVALCVAGVALAAPAPEAPPTWFGLIAAWLGCDTPTAGLDVLDDLDMAVLLGEGEP